MMPLVLDLETSGLDPTNNFITMVGTMDDDGVRVFSSPASEFRKDPLAAESNLLHRLSEATFKCHSLLTYNGLHFDMGFLATRLMRHQLPSPSFMSNNRHIYLMRYATHLNGGARISKDMAASKYCNLYVSRANSGSFLAQIYAAKF